VNAWPFVLSRSSHGKIINLLDTKIAGHDRARVAYILSKHVLAVLPRRAGIRPRRHGERRGTGLILPPRKDDDYDRLAQGAAETTRRAGDITDAALYLLRAIL
jgi:hypothetical protein